MNVRTFGLLWLGSAACSEWTVNGRGDPEPGIGAPMIEIEPSFIDFGEVALGASAGRQVTITNGGDARLRIESMTVDGEPAFDVGWNAPLPFEIGAGLTFSFSLMMPAEARGQFEGSLVFDSNAANARDGEMSFLGSVVGGELVVDPPLVEFDPITPRCREEQTVTLSNVGDDDVGVRRVHLDGPSEIGLVGPELLPFALKPGESVEVAVEALLDDGGVAAGALIVETAGQQGEVQVPVRAVAEWGDPRVDSAVVPDRPRASMLFAVDTSNSMSDDQEQLSREFPAFLNALETWDVDWRVGVVSHAPGCFNNGVLSATTPNLANVFGDAVHVIDQSNPIGESLLEATLQALVQTAPGGCNEGFFDARGIGGGDLHVVFLSDEADQSGQPWSWYLPAWRTFTPRGGRIIANGVLDIYGDCGGDSPGPWGYFEMIEGTNGRMFDICDGDWGSGLTYIAEDAVRGYREIALLSQIIDASSLEVRIDGVVQTNGWTYQEATRTIAFEVDLPSGALVEVVYQGVATCDP